MALIEINRSSLIPKTNTQERNMVKNIPKRRSIVVTKTGSHLRMIIGNLKTRRLEMMTSGERKSGKKSARGAKDRSE